MAKLTYADYRPIREGDPGWTPERQKARQYYSPSRKVIIPLRQFQRLARGMTYTEFRKRREARGVPKGRRAPYEDRFRQRADYLKDKFAAKQGTVWDDLPDSEQTFFWDLYHELTEGGEPTEQEYHGRYEDYFDLEYDDYENIEYGPTP